MKAGLSKTHKDPQLYVEFKKPAMNIILITMIR